MIILQIFNEFLHSSSMNSIFLYTYIFLIFFFDSIGMRGVHFYYIVSNYHININIIDSIQKLHYFMPTKNDQFVQLEANRTTFERLRDHDVELDNLNDCITCDVGCFIMYMYIGFKNCRKCRNAIVFLLKFHFNCDFRTYLPHTLLRQ